MSNSRGCSASGVHDKGRWGLCTLSGVVSGEFEKCSSSLMCWQNSVMYLCSSNSQNVLLVGQNFSLFSRSLMSSYVSVCEMTIALRFSLVFFLPVFPLGTVNFVI